MRHVLAALAMIVVLPAAGFLLALRGHGDGPALDCSTITLASTPRSWHTADPGSQGQTLANLSRCDRLKGRRSAEIAAGLGPPDATDVTEIDYVVNGPSGRDVMHLRLDADQRIASTFYEIPPVPGGP